MELDPAAVSARYAPSDERPLGSFLALMGTYGALVGAGVLGLRRIGVRLPENVGVGDVALIAVATHKLSRLIAKDPVTSPLRAPFVRFAGTSGEAELNEEVRGTGPQKAIGELVTCPFCVGQWVATGLVFGFLMNPKVTRLVATVFTSLTAADFLQHAYAHVESS
jgi:hypothetical protein